MNYLTAKAVFEKYGKPVVRRTDNGLATLEGRASFFYIREEDGTTRNLKAADVTANDWFQKRIAPVSFEKVDTSNPALYPKEKFLPMNMALINGLRS